MLLRTLPIRSFSRIGKVSGIDPPRISGPLNQQNKELAPMSTEGTKNFSIADALQDGTRPVREGEELDLSRLEPYLRGHFPDPGGELVVKQFPSGHSNLTYSVVLGEREMVLRRPPFGSKVKTAHDMGREFRVLSKLHD